MKCIFFIVGLILVGANFSLHTYSQTPEATRADRERQARETSLERDMNRRMQDMRALDSYARKRSEKERKAAQSLRPPELDKKAKDRIKQMRMINASDVEKYRAFLNEKNTGIFKLFPNFDCLSENVVRIDGDCSQFVPESSDFSFRQGAYMHPLYHDIGFNRDEISSNAFFSQGILTVLGDVPIENISPDSAGMKFLAEFKPDLNPGDARQTATMFQKGVDTAAFHYSNSVIAAENTTYALRMIAYRVSNSLPPVSLDASLTEMKFQSLNLDKRADLTVVFRIIRKGDNGGVTIVWKEILRNEAAKIKFPKGEPLADFK